MSLSVRIANLKVQRDFATTEGGEISWHGTETSLWKERVVLYSVGVVMFREATEVLFRVCGGVALTRKREGQGPAALSGSPVAVLCN